MTFHTTISPELLGFGTSFLFVFAIVFALLVYSGIFSRRDKEGRLLEAAPRPTLALIAAVIGFIAAIYAPFHAFLQTVIPAATAILIILFFIVLLAKIFGPKEDKKPPDLVPPMIGLVGLLIVLAAVWPRVAQYFGFTGVSPETVLTAIGIIAILAILVLAYKIGTGAEPQPAARGGPRQ